MEGFEGKIDDDKLVMNQAVDVKQVHYSNALTETRKCIDCKNKCSVLFT